MRVLAADQLLVLAQISNPFEAVAFLPESECRRLVLSKRLFRARIYPAEMVYDRLHIQFPLAGEDSGIAYMLDMVAELTEGYKSGELLDVSGVIVNPDLMATELRILGATDAASVVIALVHLPANRVPLFGCKYFAHVVVPARLRHELDGELEISHILSLNLDTYYLSLSIDYPLW
jgi:hypothetical protein